MTSADDRVYEFIIGSITARRANAGWTGSVDEAGEEMRKSLNSGRGYESYFSVFSYPRSIINYSVTNKNEKGGFTLEGYDLLPDFDTYSDYFYIDIDGVGEDPDSKARAALSSLNEIINFFRYVADLDYKIPRYYYSGSKGFHIEIPIGIFGDDIKPSKIFHKICGLVAPKISRHIDSSMYDWSQVLRTPYSLHMSTHRYKIPVSPEMVMLEDYEAIKALSQTPVTVDVETYDLDEICPNNYFTELWKECERLVESDIKEEKFLHKKPKRVVLGTSYQNANYHGNATFTSGESTNPIQYARKFAVSLMSRQVNSQLAYFITRCYLKHLYMATDDDIERFADYMVIKSMDIVDDQSLGEFGQVLLGGMAESQVIGKYVGRNNALYAVVGALSQTDMSDADVFRFVNLLNSTFRPPISQKELSNTVLRDYSWKKRR